MVRKILPKHRFERFDCLETTRTAFRLQNGFHLFNTNSMLRDATDERLTSSIFDLLTILIENDGKNGRSKDRSNVFIEFF